MNLRSLVTESLIFCAKIDSFRFESKTYSQVHDFVNNELKKENISHYPVIFIDETTVKKESQRHFLLLRSLLRLMHLIPIFMGTNFNVANFLKSAEYGSRSNEAYFRMCFIHQLPRFSASLLESRKTNLYKIINYKRNYSDFTENDKNNSSKFIENVFNFLKVDRPLFVIEIIRRLESYLQRSNIFNCQEAFENL